jgi:hypothetical protein
LILKSIYLKIFKLSLLVFVSAMMISCQKAEQKAAGNASEFISDSEGYFKGIIKLEEKDVLGTHSDIVLTFNGNDVKREVTEKLFKNISYGMIYRKGQDSVDYFYTKDQKSWHTSIAKKDFQKWVQELEKPIVDPENIGSTSLAAQPPFGIIFQYFDSSGKNVVSTITSSPLKNYSAVKCQTFLVPDDKSCNVWYSDAIKIRPEILEIIEHNQPKSIKTLALQVEYFSPKSSGEKNTLDKVFDKMNKVLVKTDKKIHLNDISSNNQISIELPKNSEKVSPHSLNEIIYPAEENDGNSSSGGHHHHDIF